MAGSLPDDALSMARSLVRNPPLAAVREVRSWAGARVALKVWARHRG